MGVTITWGDQSETSLRVIYDAQWTRQSLHNAVLQAVPLLNQSRCLVHILIDQQQGPISAGDFIANTGFLRPLTEHPQVRHIVVVGATAETQALCEDYPSFHDYHFAETLEEGHTLLGELEYLSNLENLQIIGDFFSSSASSG